MRYLALDITYLKYKHCKQLPIFTSLLYIFRIPLGHLGHLYFLSQPGTLHLFLVLYWGHTKTRCFTWHHKNVTFRNILSASEQELCLNIIPTFANLIDYPSMKNSLSPRIKSACLQTSSLAVSLLLLLFHSQLVPVKVSASTKIIFFCCYVIKVPFLLPLSFSKTLTSTPTTSSCLKLSLKM